MASVLAFTENFVKERNGAVVRPMMKREAVSETVKEAEAGQHGNADQTSLQLDSQRIILPSVRAARNLYSTHSVTVMMSLLRLPAKTIISFSEQPEYQSRWAG